MKDDQVETGTHTFLRDYPMLTSNDMEDVQDFVYKNLSPHTIDVLTGRTNEKTEFNGLSFFGTKFFSSTYGEDVLISPQSDQHFITQTTLKGNTEVVLAKKSSTTRKGSTVVISPSEDYKMRLWQGSRRLTVLFDRDALEHELSNLLNLEIRKPLLFELSMNEDEKHSYAWCNSLFYLCQQLQFSKEMVGNEVFLRHANSMLMSLLLYIQPHNYSHLLNSEAIVRSPRAIRRAIAYIEDNVQHPIALSELAAASGASIRTLQKGFKKYTDKTPCEYIRLARIHAVHETLRTACPSQQVSEILFQYGITSFGHFVHSYKQIYGCTPSETLKKL